MKFWFWFSIVVVVVMIIIGGLQNYFLKRDVNSWLKRAQVASDAEDMHEYMVDLKESMEAKGMTHGQARLIFTKPETDYKLIFRAVTRNMERLERMKEMDKTSTTYQVALDDVRGAIRELDLHISGFWFARQAGFIETIIGIVFIIVAVVIWWREFY